MLARSFKLVITLELLSMVCLNVPSFARGNDLSITDGAGEQVQIKHSLFGRNKTVMRDRFGDGFAQQNGFFGSKASEVSVLGNRVMHKKGLLGNSETDAITIFGANMVTKKGIFGRRTTAVDLSGTNQLIHSFLGHSGPGPGYPGAPMFGGGGGAPPMMQPSATGEPHLTRIDAATASQMPGDYANGISNVGAGQGGGVNVNGDPLPHQ
jgi:hypothetical protein